MEDKIPNLPDLDFGSQTRFSRKTILSAVVVILLLVSIPLGVYLVGQKQIFKPKAFEKNDKTVTEKKGSPSVYRGYIVELKNDPTVKLIKRLKDLGKNEKEINKSAENYQRTLDGEHQKAKAEILAKLGKKNIAITKTASKDNLALWREYRNVFNGLALDIDDNEAQKLKEAPSVKNVYRNNEIKASLMDSVPLINADDVWQMKDQKGNNITGKGVNIAIADTGIDFTHQDLGASQIPEHDFQKIIADSGYHLAMSSDKYKFAFDTFDYNTDSAKIYVYSSTGQKLNEFLIPENEKYIAQIVIEGNYLAFFGGLYGDNAGVSIYNLTTGEHKRVENTNVVGTMYIFENTLYYGTGKDDWPSYDVKNVSFAVYNLLTGSISHSIPAISPTNSYTIMAAFDKNRVVFPVPEKDHDLCAKNIYIHSFDGNPGQSYTPPEVGSILDFKGDEILYLACNSDDFDPTGSSYYLFNIKTGSATKLAYLPDTSPAAIGLERFNGLSAKTQKFSTQTSTFNWNRYNLGLIGDSVVYFKRNFTSDKVIIYNKLQQKYYRLNVTMSIGRFAVEEDLICFVNFGVNCHTYDPTNPYTLPTDVFNSKVTGGYNFIFPDEFPLDDYGHGTHVASIAAGNGALKGIAPDARLITYKVMDSGGYGYTSDIIAAIEMGVATRLDPDTGNNIDIMNFSLGADCFGVYNPNCGPDDPMSQVVDNAMDAGIIMVVAAGNSGGSAQTITSPGTARKAITVGAVDKNKQIASFSSRGPVVWDGETINKPDVVAPGVSICAAEWDGWYTDRRCVDDKHIAIDGTSMATPHVAGLAALVKQMYPNLTPLEIKEAVKNGAKDLGYDINTQGKGLVDALETIELLVPTPVPKACLDVITYARNSQTGAGECKQFPNSCLPEGWVLDPGCNLPATPQ